MRAPWRPLDYAWRKRWPVVGQWSPSTVAAPRRSSQTPECWRIPMIPRGLRVPLEICSLIRHVVTRWAGGHATARWHDSAWSAWDGSTPKRLARPDNVYPAEDAQCTPSLEEWSSELSR